MMKNLLISSIQNAMDYTEYNQFFKKLVEDKKTTGEQTEEKIEYTKLNFSRTKRLDKTAKIPSEYIEKFNTISENQTWLTITEPWCGDASQTLPFLNKIAELNNHVTLKIVLRDENPALMNKFLTNGSQSIPIVIIINEQNEVVNQFGPRSKNASKLVTDYKTQHGQIDATLRENLQVWYNNDKGLSIIKDISELV